MLARALLTAKEMLCAIRMERSLCVRLCLWLSVWLYDIICNRTVVMLVVAMVTGDLVSMQLSCCCHGYGQSH